MANATGKQMSALYKFTSRRFWMPDNAPQPTKVEATAMLSLCFRWKDACGTDDRDGIAGAKGALTKMVRKWFPEWDSSELEDKIRRKSSKFNYEKQHKNDGSGINSKNGEAIDDPNHQRQATDNECEGAGDGGNEGSGEGAGDGSDNGNESNSEPKGSDDGSEGGAGESDSEAEPKSADPTCPKCDGNGGENGEPCEGCGGTEPSKADPECEKCNGQGGSGGEACEECGGRQPSGSNGDGEQGDGQEDGDEGEGEGGQEGDDESSDEGEGEGEGGGEAGDEKSQEQEVENEDGDDEVDPIVQRTAEKIKAGLRNFYWFGPAGTGKTTLTKILGHTLTVNEMFGHKWPVTVLSCNAGTSPSEIRGFYFPEPRPSIVMSALAVPGIIVFDEFTTLDPSVAAVANALLANGEVETSMGNVRRHKDCVIIVTSNTLGTGADREYIGNNQLDAATLDRFVGGKFHVDYSKEYEAKYDKQVVEWVYLLRQAVKQNSFRRVVSTRAIQACTALKRAGIEWKHEPIFDWTPEERGAIPGWGDASEAKFFGDR